MYHWKQMSKNETAFLKGVGMLLILFHNYSHQVQPWMGENEFVFSYQFGQSFLLLLQQHPFDLIRLLFAFFGHYGVQLFIFVSGYGLFLSYRKRRITWFSFFKKHLLKLYPVYIIVVFLFLFSISIRDQTLPALIDFKYALYDLLFIQNFIPGAFFKLAGPWWFFSLIVQLYAVFPLTLKLFRRFGIKAIIITGAASWVITIVLNPWFNSLGLSLYFMFIGRLPVFCLGIWFAWLSNFKLRWGVMVLSFIVVVIGNFNALFWPLTMLASTLLLLMAFRPIIHLKGIAKVNSFIIWIGVNSLYIFAVHIFPRWLLIVPATKLNNPVSTIVLGLIFLLATLIIAILVKKFEKGVQLKLNSFASK